MKRQRFFVERDFERIATVAVFATFALASCDHAGNPLSGPSSGEPETKLTNCDSSCVLFSDSRPFEVSKSLRDSSGATLELAAYRIHGSKGDRVGLQLASLSDRMSIATKTIPVLVEADGIVSRVMLGDLLTRKTVYQFSRTDDVLIRYSIPRAIQELPLESMTLSQLLGSAKIVSSRLHWRKPHSSVAGQTGVLLSRVASCTVNGTPYADCGSSGTLSPLFYFTSGVGCLWTSDPSNGPSGTITITFSVPVSNVYVYICDADYVGNAMIAYDANGTQIGSVAFAGDEAPSVPTIEWAGVNQSGIRKITLVAAPEDFVVYQNLKFSVPATDIINLTPGSAIRRAGQQVVFTGTSGSGAAIANQVWTWVPTGGPPKGGPLTVVPSSCASHSTCTMKVYEPGTLELNGTVAGAVAATGTSSVKVLLCAADNDSDPRIADPGFRKTTADIAAETTTWERGGRSYLNGEISPIGYRVIEFASLSNSCVTFSYDENSTPLTSFPGYTIPDAADFHTHPWHYGEHFSPVCNRPANEYAGVGPSDDDYKYEVFRNRIGYMADANGALWRWNSQWEIDYVHPSRYLRQSDANGVSTCLVAAPLP